MKPFCVFLAVTIAGLRPAIVTAQKPTPASLKDKSDEELVELVTGRNLPPVRDPSAPRLTDRTPPPPIDRLWEMPPAEAALAFVSEYTNARSGLKMDNTAVQPPKNGEIGLRWVGGGHYVPVSHGVTILKYSGYDSELLISQVEIAGKAEPQEIEEAVKKADSYPMRPLVAQKTYEILWWLRHVRFTDKNEVSGWAETSKFPDLPTRFWIEPGGPNVSGLFLREDDGPCGECLAKGNEGSYAEFAMVLLRRLIERSGIKPRNPMPKIGRHIDADEDAKFLHEPPPERSNASELKRWIRRHTDILRNAERQYLHGSVMDRLVPISDPLRYKDAQIDDALLVVMRRGLEAIPKLKELDELHRREQSEEIVLSSEDPPDAAKEEQERAKREERRAKERQLRDIRFDGMNAAEKLGFHDAVGSFAELFALAKQPDIDGLSDYNRPLIAAASIAGRHPRFRPQLAAHLREALSAAGERTARGTPILEAVWRADLRELTPLLENLASSPRPASNPNDVRPSAVEKASLILTAWRETDALTKTKIDALLSSVIGGGNSIPEVLRAEFEALQADDKFTFRQFINWMRTAGASVQLRYLENTFTPHTPRPDVDFER